MTADLVTLFGDDAGKLALPAKTIRTASQTSAALRTPMGLGAMKTSASCRGMPYGQAWGFAMASPKSSIVISMRCPLTD